MLQFVRGLFKRFFLFRLKRKIMKLLKPYSCEFIDFGPNAVAVKGDTRVVGPSVIIAFPNGMSDEKIAQISNEVTNKNRAVCRVLRHIFSADEVDDV